MKKILKVTVNILTDILLIAALTILVLSAYTAYQYKENPENAYLFGYKPILVLTGSMEPTMRVNSICVAKKADFNEIKLDDIVMYQIDDKLITHRVVAITDEGFRTKGDNNNTEDAYYITENNLKAKVVYVANWTADIINDLQTTQGKIKWIGFPIFVIVVIGVLIKVIKKILSSPDEDEDEKSKTMTEVFAEPDAPVEETVETPVIEEETPPDIIEEEPEENTEEK